MGHSGVWRACFSSHADDCTPGRAQSGAEACSQNLQDTGHVISGADMAASSYHIFAQ